MATLKIKDFPDALYKRLKEQAQRERRTIAQQAIHVLDQFLEQEKTESILGLRGLGKEVWEGIDVAEYIREERDSWDS